MIFSNNIFPNRNVNYFLAADKDQASSGANGEPSNGGIDFSKILASKEGFPAQKVEILNIDSYFDKEMLEAELTALGLTDIEKYKSQILATEDRSFEIIQEGLSEIIDYYREDFDSPELHARCDLDFFLANIEKARSVWTTCDFLVDKAFYRHLPKFSDHQDDLGILLKETLVIDGIHEDSADLVKASIYFTFKVMLGISKDKNISNSQKQDLMQTLVDHLSMKISLSASPDSLEQDLSKLAIFYKTSGDQDSLEMISKIIKYFSQYYQGGKALNASLRDFGEIFDEAQNLDYNPSDHVQIEALREANELSAIKHNIMSIINPEGVSNKKEVWDFPFKSIVNELPNKNRIFFRSSPLYDEEDKNQFEEVGDEFSAKHSYAAKFKLDLLEEFAKSGFQQWLVRGPTELIESTLMENLIDTFKIQQGYYDQEKTERRNLENQIKDLLVGFFESNFCSSLKYFTKSGYVKERKTKALLKTTKFLDDMKRIVDDYRIKLRFKDMQEDWESLIQEQSGKTLYLSYIPDPNLGDDDLSIHHRLGSNLYGFDRLTSVGFDRYVHQSHQFYANQNQIGWGEYQSVASKAEHGLGNLKSGIFESLGRKGLAWDAAADYMVTTIDADFDENEANDPIGESSESLSTHFV